MHFLCPHCRNPIEIVPAPADDEIVCPSCGSSFRIEPGDTTSWRPSADSKKIGRFAIQEAVGAGAFGTVYRARDPELDRVVAVKVPRRGQLAGPDEVNRFLREARSAAQLEHSGIVPIHEIGEADGVPYIVSGFVFGVTLADLLSARRPNFKESAQIIATVAEALHYAHEHGVVHRDVKPSNIMITDEGAPLLMDFGLAKREAGEITITLDGHILGTPAYMSPEQARGESHEVDGRSDVYSLGVILYSMLTGELPFRGTKRMLLHQVLHDEPRPPCRLNDHIPRDLETICLKAMAKEPARRYASAHELAEDLHRFLKDLPILARPVGRSEKLWRWARRNPLIAGMSAVAALLLLATLAATSLGYWSSSRAWAEAENQRGQAVEEASKAKEAQRQEASAHQEASARAQEARSHVRTALLRQAEALRQSTHAGRRWQALAALRQAAAIEPGIDLRTEYLRALDLADFRRVAHIVVPKDAAVVASFPPVTSPAPSEPEPLTPWLFGTLASIRGSARVCNILTHDRRTMLGDYDLSKAEFRGLQSVAPDWNIQDALSADGRQVMVFHAGQRAIGVWDLGAGKLMGQTQLPASLASIPKYFAINPQADRFAVVSPPPANAGIFGNEQTYGVAVFACPSCQLLKAWELKAFAVDSLKFDPTGRRLALDASLQSSEQLFQGVRIWDTDSGKEIATLTVSPGERWVGDVSSRHVIDFTRDGRLLAAGGFWKGFIKIFELSTTPGSGDGTNRVARARLTLAGHQHLPQEVQFSPDGDWLLTSDFYSEFKMWEVNTGNLVAQAKLNKLPQAEAGTPLPRLASTLAIDTREGLDLVEPSTGVGRSFWLPPRVRERTPRLDLYSLAFSADDRWLACSTEQSASPFLIDLDHPQPRPESLPGYIGAAALAFAPKGEQLWAAGVRQNEVWNLPSSTLGMVSQRGPGTAGFPAIAFTATGQRVAAGVPTLYEVQVLDLNTGKRIWSQDEPAEHYSGLTLQFSPDGQRLLTRATVSTGVRDHLRDGNTGKLLHERTGASVDTLFRGNSLLLLQQPATLSMLQVPDDRMLEPIRKPVQQPVSRQLRFFSDDGGVCAEVSIQEIVVWDLEKRRQRCVIKETRQGAKLEQVKLSSDGQRIGAIVSGTLQIWDTQTGEIQGTIATKAVQYTIPAGDGEVLLLEPDDRVSAWQPGKKETRILCQLPALPSNQAGRPGVAKKAQVFFSRDGRRLVRFAPEATQGQYLVTVWSLPSGMQERSFQVNHPSTEWAHAAVNADVTRLAVAGRLYRLQIQNLDLGTGRYLDEKGRISSSFLSMTGHRFSSNPFGAESYLASRSLQLSPDASFLARVAHKKTAEIEVVDQVAQAIASRITVEGILTTTALCHEGKLLAVGVDEAIRLHDPRSGKLLVSCTGHEGRPTDLAFDGGGTLLVSGSADDGSVRLWNPLTGEMLARFDTGMATLSRVALSPSGRWLAVGDAAGHIRVWDLREVRRELAEAGLDWSSPPILKAPRSAPGSAAAYLDAGRTHHLFGRYEQAVRAYDRALELNPGDAVALRDRGDARYHRGQFAEAVADFDAARRLSPELPMPETVFPAFVHRALARLATGEWQAAQADFQVARQKAGNQKLTLRQQAVLRLAAGDLRGYRQACGQILETRSDRPGFAAEEAPACILAPQALADYTKLLERAEDALDADPKQAWSQSLLGKVLYRAGRVDEALPRLQQGEKLGGPEPEMLNRLFLAMAHHQTGQPAEARTRLERARQQLKTAAAKPSAPEAALQDWSYPVESYLVLREAQQLIEGK